MGSMHAQEYRELLGREVGLKAHLDANFFPPLPMYVRSSIIDGFKEYWNGKIPIDELVGRCYLRDIDALYKYFGFFLGDEDEE